MNKYTINDITRASGGFAMLAVDQREAMRMMFCRGWGTRSGSR